MVRIGKKPIMNYVVACMTLLNTGVADVMVRGRGQSITQAAEVVDMLRRAFMKNIRIHSVDIGTEEVQRDDGSTASLAMIEIIVGHYVTSIRCDRAILLEVDRPSQSTISLPADK